LITNELINEFIEFNVTSDVQAFLDGTATNFGWIIKKDNEAQNGKIEFASKENVNNIPQLILNFSGSN